MTYKIFAAMKAFIVYDEKVLLVRESSKYKDGTNIWKYDVVWWRVEQGERFDEWLIREVKEETGLDIEIWRPFSIDEWRPEVRGEKWQIIASFFECHAKTDNIQLSDDHEDYIWIDPSEYKNYSIIPNLIPSFEAYLEFKN